MSPAEKPLPEPAITTAQRLAGATRAIQTVSNMVEGDAGAAHQLFLATTYWENHRVLMNRAEHTRMVDILRAVARAATRAADLFESTPFQRDIDIVP